MKRPTIWDYTNRDTGKVVKKVHMRSERAMGLAQMIDGLCSKYWRDRYEGDGGVPDIMPAPGAGRPDPRATTLPCGATRRGLRRNRRPGP